MSHLLIREEFARLRAMEVSTEEQHDRIRDAARHRLGHIEKRLGHHRIRAITDPEAGRTYTRLLEEKSALQHVLSGAGS